jgi:hypothetical protein
MPAIGQDCTITVQHASVNSEATAGFCVKPDTYVLRLPKLWFSGINGAGIAGVTSPLQPGKHVVECVVLCRAHMVRLDGSLDTRTGEQHYQNLRAFAAQVNTPITLTDLSKKAFTVGFEQMEAQWSPLGGPWLKEREVRCVFVET